MKGCWHRLGSLCHEEAAGFEVGGLVKPWADKSAVAGPRVWTRFIAEGSVGHLAVFYERDHTGLE